MSERIAEEIGANSTTPAHARFRSKADGLEPHSSSSMIRVSVQQAKNRFPALLAIVEKEGEVVLIVRNGCPVAELRASGPNPPFDPLAVHPELVGRILYDPTEPATPADWSEPS